jgi:pyroglutamyl-peptidase
MALTILLTGFGPFPGAPFNPTGELARALMRKRRPAFANVRLVAHVFPTSYRAVDRELPRLLAHVAPDAMLMFGLATRSRMLRVEMRARNAVSAVTRDAEGRLSLGTSIVPGGPAAVSFDLPAHRLVLAARAARVPVRASRDAGRYLCNYLCWQATRASERPGGPCVIAFMHVPKIRQTSRQRRATPSQPTMQELVRAGEAILLSIVAIARARACMKKR